MPVINVEKEMRLGLSHQSSSLGGETLCSILEKHFPDKKDIWIEAIQYIPSNQPFDTRDFISRAAQCPDWNDIEYLDFYFDLASLIENTGISLDRACSLFAEKTQEFSDYENKANLYFEIIEYQVRVQKDWRASLKWVTTAINDLGHLEWGLTSISPQDLCPNYQLDDIQSLADVGSVYFFNGDIKSALDFWSKLDAVQIKKLPETLLHTIVDYAFIHMPEDLFFLTDHYDGKRDQVKKS